MACEAVLSVTMFGNSLSEHLARYLQPGAWPGLVAQLSIVAMPALALLARDR
jgi:hypothetical protein